MRLGPILQSHPAHDSVQVLRYKSHHTLRSHRTTKGASFGICKYQSERSPALSSDWVPLSCVARPEDNGSLRVMTGYRDNGQLDKWCLDNLETALEGAINI